MNIDLESYPNCINAEQLSTILGISKAGAYRLMHQNSFPTLHIGRRMLVPKTKLAKWIDQNSRYIEETMD